MERIAFLVEKTGEQLSCLLNPESVVVRRMAGIAARSGTTGIITGLTLTDDPVISTGGGKTEIDLDLLFDIDIDREMRQQVTSRAATEIDLPQPDVRDLTRPIWNLAENGESADGFGAPPLVRMIWGRAWNVSGVVVSVAEKFERFEADGRPRRSWLRLRLRRMNSDIASAPPPMPASTQFEVPFLDGGAASDERKWASVVLMPNEAGLPTPRIDEIVTQHYGDGSLTNAVLAFNNIEDPLSVAEGQTLILPDITELGQ